MFAKQHSPYRNKVLEKVCDERDSLRAEVAALRTAQSDCLTLIGNVNHRTGHGANSAAMRGDILHAIRDILCRAALGAKS